MEDLKNKYDQWREAVMNVDRMFLEKAYTEDFCWTNALGISQTKKESIEKIESGAAKYTSWTIENFTIKSEEDIATIESREVLKMIVYGQRVTTTRDVSVTFRKIGEEWFLENITEAIKDLD